MRRPALFLALAVLAGAVAGRVVILPLWAGVALCGGSLAGAGFMAWRWRRTRLSVAELSAIRLCFATFFFLALTQQNEIVRREQMGDRQVRELARFERVAIRGDGGGGAGAEGEWAGGRASRCAGRTAVGERQSGEGFSGQAGSLSYGVDGRMPGGLLFGWGGERGLEGFSCKRAGDGGRGED